ncbi:hypothetical protein QWZ10_01015 [Paracoccus cavernae]|uniref:CHASE2 domain-containing protein n=1 Tax=Paracoccus cavernae TaxID=1571207 RepID=A0ABT8D1U3_9RHOB|nr:hypothetical protein [Paracoccus cavernae]
MLGLAAAGLGYGAYALAKKREALPWLVRWRVQPREWVGHAPLRIAAVSVRCAARTPVELRHFAALLRRIERLGADVVVILDLDLGHDRGPEDEAHAEAAVAALARLHGPKGRFFLPDAAGAELMADAGFVPLSRHGRPLPDMASGAVSETAPAPDAAPAAAGGFAVAFLHAADHHRPEGRSRPCRWWPLPVIRRFSPKPLGSGIKSRWWLQPRDRAERFPQTVRARSPPSAISPRPRAMTRPDAP